MKQRIVIFTSILLAMLHLAACSDQSRPDSPEPTLEIEEAEGITRTEATVMASIDRHGGVKLSYVALRCYHQNQDATDEITIEADPTSSDFEFHLTALHPGTAYECVLEAGTETASLRSRTISFTTIPNDPPMLSAPEPLSTGPLGIIIRFSILDDGGEPLIKAGCEVKANGSSESRRLFLAESDLNEGEHRLEISGLAPETTYTVTPFASNSQGEAYGGSLEYTTRSTVLLKEAGMLAPLLTADEDVYLDSLTISGLMNGDDFRALRAALGAPDDNNSHLRLSGIDLSDVEIVEGGGSFDGQRFTEAGRLSTGILADCTLLSTAILPNSVVGIGRDALARCPLLETFTVPAHVESLLPSADCVALRSIEVSPANTSFASIDGVLFNQDATEILWFPLGKPGDYTLPSTITAIGEGAFAGTSITGLIIPSSVTEISRGAFAGSSLVSIVLPDNLTNIREGLLQNCSSLTTVRLGEATEYVGDYAFDGTSLTDLYIAASIPPVAAPEAFANSMHPLAELCTLHVPPGTRKLYRNHQRWGTFTKIVED